MIAQVGPLIPVEVGGAAWLIIGFGVIMSYLVAFGLKNGYEYSLGALLNRLAKVTGHIWAVGPVLQKSVDAVNHFVQAQLGTFLAANEQVVAKWWHGMEWLVKTTGDTLESFGADVHATIAALVHGTIPNAVHGVTGPLTQSLASIRRSMVAQAAALERDLSKRAKGIEAQLARDFGLAFRGIDRVRGSTAAAIAHLGTVVHGDIASLRDYTHRNLGRRVKAIEGKVAGAALAAAAITAVTTLFGFLRCSNVQKAGKGLCRMDGNMLDSLLLDTLLIASALSVVEFARELQAVEHEVVGLMLRGVKETRSLDGL